MSLLGLVFLKCSFFPGDHTCRRFVFPRECQRSHFQLFRLHDEEWLACHFILKSFLMHRPFGIGFCYSVEKGDQSDVKTAANLVKQMAYQNKNNLQAGMIVAGWDKHLGGQVYGIPLGGTLLRLPFTIGGGQASSPAKHRRSDVLQSVAGCGL